MSKNSTAAAARALAARRKVFGGPPVKLAPCPHCGALFGARALRTHKPHCPSKPLPASRRANAAK